MLAFDYSPGAIRGALTDAATFALGTPVSEPLQFVSHARSSTEYFGTAGTQQWAIALIEMAMWDAHARSLEVPIWRLFGGSPRRIPVYGSGGWLSYSLAELVEEVSGYARRGFTAVKIKVGAPHLAADVERVAKVREAIGPTAQLMVDANQGFDVLSAKRLAEEISRYHITWFEEPVSNTDYAGYARLSSGVPIPLAMGEREYDLTALRALIERNALDAWQPDVLRIGGVTGWRASAIVANSYNTAVRPHYYKEYDVPLLCTIPGGGAAEHFDWVDPLLDKPLEIEDGYALPSEEPGWGFRFRPDALGEHILHVE
jgi:L-alanine-DL-glutamate epimerase-like enolase superfamily enzyme